MDEQTDLSEGISWRLTVQSKRPWLGLLLCFIEESPIAHPMTPDAIRLDAAEASASCSTLGRIGSDSPEWLNQIQVKMLQVSHISMQLTNLPHWKTAQLLLPE